MTNIRKDLKLKTLNVNFEERTIEMTKTFANKARQYGSDEYKELVKAGNEFPTYKFVIVKSSKKSSDLKGLTYDFMRKYIMSNDPSLIDDFNTLCGKTENDDEIVVKASYGEIKQWFLSKFDIADRSNINRILGKCAA